MKNNPKIVLASGSPRRKKLLIEAGFNPLVHPSNINEESEERDAHKLTQVLSQKKGIAIIDEFPTETIIAADTVVQVENKILGKPSDFNHAFEMLKLLSSKSHKIVTGVTILKGSTIFFQDSDEAILTLRHLTDQEITGFLNSTNPYDKAGAYSVEELPKNFIEKLEGDMTTILGLPLSLVIPQLKKLYR